MIPIGRPEGAYGAAALLETRAVIRSGGIAIKGIGGFTSAATPTNEVSGLY